MPLSWHQEAPAILGVPCCVDTTLSKASPLFFLESMYLHCLLLSLTKTVSSPWIWGPFNPR